MLPPRRTFTQPGVDIGPVAHILSNVLYMHEYPSQLTPAEVQDLVGDAQYLWGTGVEMAFLASRGFMTWYFGDWDPAATLRQETPYTRGRIGSGLGSWASKIVEYRQTLVSENLAYFNALEGRVIFNPKRPTWAKVTEALSRGMVVDLGWGEEKGPEARAALAYGIEGPHRNLIKVYCPYEEYNVLKTYDPDEFRKMWRQALGINVYWYRP